MIRAIYMKGNLNLLRDFQRNKNKMYARNTGGTLAVSKVKKKYMFW
jgi:hypothetical protein